MRDGCVYIFIGAFFAGKCGALIIMNTAKAHCTAITDVFNNAVNPQNGFKFAVGNKGSVQKNTAVIKLFVLGKQKAERVCA